MNRKRCLQSTFDAFLKPNPTVTDDGTAYIVQLMGNPSLPKHPRSPTVGEDAVFVSAKVLRRSFGSLVTFVLDESHW